MDIFKKSDQGGPLLKVWNAVSTQIKKFASEFITLEGNLAMSWLKCLLNKYFWVNKWMNEY